MEETARRIARAAFELHASIGPSRTTISAIAERAGVQRLTVYRHFPDDLSLFRACVDHGLTVFRLPDPEPWVQTKDPAERLVRGLVEIYRYYAESGSAWANIYPDLQKIPALWEANAGTFEHFGKMHGALCSGWRARGRKRAQIEGAIWLAMQFPTWQALVLHRGLTIEEAAGVTVASVRCLTSRGTGA